MKASLVILTYNQEDYIGDAILAALSQTYRPLELVISDDFSTDLTFSKVLELVSSYAGDIEIKVNRNTYNLGIGGHVAKVANLVSGDVVILAAGDDISCHDRVSVHMKCYIHDANVFAAFSDMEVIDTIGLATRKLKKDWSRFLDVKLTDLVQGGGGVGIGASYSYRVECFRTPWLYPSHLMNEDRILPLRAGILGYIKYIPMTLVRYRELENSASRTQVTLAKWKKKHLEELKKTILWARSCELINDSNFRKLNTILFEHELTSFQMQSTNKVNPRKNKYLVLIVQLVKSPRMVLLRLTKYFFSRI